MLLIGVSHIWPVFARCINQSRLGDEALSANANHLVELAREDIGGRCRLGRQKAESGALMAVKMVDDQLRNNSRGRRRLVTGKLIS